MFIISCGNTITQPSNSGEVIGDITYYDPNNTIIKTYPYNLYDGITGTFVGAEGAFKKIAESANAIIYVEESYVDKGITKEGVISFLREFEKYLPREIEIYGEIPDFDGNGKVIFLMANINTNEATTAMAGYFYQSDLIFGKEGVRGEYLHVNVPTNNDTVGTMMHELQHLINAYNNLMQGKAMDIWLNEALSESTSLIFSEPLIGEREDIFNTSTYYSFYTWKLLYTDNTPEGTVSVGGDDNIFISYASSLMFMKWIDLKTGGKQEIYKEIAHSDPSLTDEERLMSVLSKYNLGNDMNDVLLNWIEGINNGDIPGIKLSAIDPDDQKFNINGSIPLLPRSIVLYSTADNPQITSGGKLLTRPLGQTGLSAVINTSVNQESYEGIAETADVENLTIKKAANLNSSIKYQRFNLQNRGYFIDKVITEEDEKNIKKQ
ncbi:hypothetical protein Bint_0196 [Brachyspira intermedia PWS/A]|uniref:Peptidase M30, hyicolysin n=2 Tax=Brachyspira intermedia TaxID=84377 RepID=G0EQC5_BRAIP|nr:hypothetical protein Bint_0196 [Brachyspira intermedia PWS/A]